MTRPLMHRFALSVALSLSAASLVAFAAEPRDSTEIEVSANGKTERLTITDLKMGETRQLYSEAGTLVTATRTAESLELDIGGDKTSIKMIEGGAIDDAEIAALIEAHGGDAGAGGKRIVHIRHDDKHVAGTGDHADAHRKIIVITGDKGELDGLGTDDTHVVLKHDGEPGGKHVTVRRKVVKSAGDDTK